MLEDRSCLVSRVFSSSCGKENKWSYINYRLEMEIPKSKRPLEIKEEEELRVSKLPKPSSASEKVEVSPNSPDLNLAPAEQSDDHLYAQDCLDTGSIAHHIGRVESLDISMNSADESENPHRHLDESDQLETAEAPPDLSLALAHQSSSPHHSQNILNLDPPVLPGSEAEMDWTLPNMGLTLADQSNAHCCTGKNSDLVHVERACALPDLSYLSLSLKDQSNNQRHAGHQSNDSSSDSLIHPIGRDMSINCLLRCSRSNYGSIASVNRSFRSLIRSGELYRLRRNNGVIEHWIYFSCHLLEWEAFDPICRRWMHLPRMPSNECFMCSDKESLAVGTELLVFGKEVTAHVIYRYSILTNSWSSGMRMNAPRCLFGSASLGEKAILAGGCDSQGNILSSAELYNSETGKWETLPSMNKSRKMCSGVFMDGKFYVLGGIGGSESKVLTCGEEFNLETRTWTEIPKMSPGRSDAARENDMPAATEAPPLVAVVNNELYSADYAAMVVRKYDKDRKRWYTVGSLPQRLVSMNGWGLAFRACGDRLVVIGGPRTLGEGSIELNSWVPGEGQPQWNLLARKRSGNFVYNCAVMGC
ncbi:F-box/kelch-repeat protein At1g26930-like [Malania oleifera]|uniref:F-box/kelch-repeat protein At1g26930-like n=1 Tax=Malania oleifera TaxID=397392 RepID=UPI0025AE133F|nr:F-box/kelch-repeat protein At1g26930-like [Malania oleifera]